MDGIILTPREKIVIDILLRGERAYPVSNLEIQKILKTNSGSVRTLISDLREKGIRVCSDLHGIGYWIAKDDADYLEYRNMYMASINKRLARIKAMDQYCEGQIAMEGV